LLLNWLAKVEIIRLAIGHANQILLAFNIRAQYASQFSLQHFISPLIHIFVIVINLRPVRLAYQPPASSTFLSEQTSHQQPASSTILSEQTSTSHQPPANQIGC
jgi:hypothetical protein